MKKNLKLFIYIIYNIYIYNFTILAFKIFTKLIHRSCTLFIDRRVCIDIRWNDKSKVFLIGCCTFLYVKKVHSKCIFKLKMLLLLIYIFYSFVMVVHVWILLAIVCQSVGQSLYLSVMPPDAVFPWRQCHLAAWSADLRRWTAARRVPHPKIQMMTSPAVTALIAATVSMLPPAL